MMFNKKERRFDVEQMIKDSVEFQGNYAVWDNESDWEDEKELLILLNTMHKKGFQYMGCISETRCSIFVKFA